MSGVRVNSYSYRIPVNTVSPILYSLVNSVSPWGTLCPLTTQGIMVPCPLRPGTSKGVPALHQPQN